MARTKPESFRVVTAHRPVAGPGWKETLDQLGLRESEQWRNVRLTPQVERRLAEHLQFAGRSSMDVLLDPDGCVVHSLFSPHTLLPVLTHALRTSERCAGDDTEAPTAIAEPGTVAARP